MIFLIKKKKENIFLCRLSSDEETLRARIHVKLKEIMLQVDLDEVTSKFVSEPFFFFGLNDEVGFFFFLVT
jgi:hypothetical protein